MLKAESGLQSVLLRESFLQREAAAFFKRAKRVVQHPAFDVLIAPTSGGSPKLLVVTPARIGNAPERNRIRRRIKAIFYEMHPIDSTYDVVFIIKKRCLQLTFGQLVNLINTELKQYAPTGILS